MGRKLLNSELGRPSVEEFRKVPRIPVVLVLDNIRSRFNIGAAFRTADAFAAEKVYLCGICATPPSAEIHKSALGAELSMEWQHFDETPDAVQELKDQGYTIVSIEQTEDSVMLDRLQLPLQQRAQEQPLQQHAPSASQSYVAANHITHDGVSLTPAEHSTAKTPVENSTAKTPTEDSTANLHKEKYALVFGNEVAGVQQSVVDMSDAVIEIPQCGTKHSINVSVSVGVVLWEFFQRLRR
ncbi:MAG: TrmH family RNA methyltransferase [Bacteroidales bacterium]